jgi:hypothetical protein
MVWQDRYRGLDLELELDLDLDLDLRGIKPA